ncbi:hypothetical protein ABFV70_11325 [Staphylococcus arlettae]
MNIYVTIGLIAFILLIPEFIRIARILHLKHLGIKYIGNGKYEEIGNKKYKWYEWLR